MKGVRRGAWAPACAGHVYTLAQPFESYEFAVPSGSKNTLHNSLEKFIKGENATMIDDV